MNENLIKHPLVLRWNQQRHDVVFDIELTKRIRLMNFNEVLCDDKKCLLYEIEYYDE